MRVAAPAKINLTLDILGRRPDGYHDISSVMQTLEWADQLDIDLTDAPQSVEISVIDSIGAGGVPSDETNLAHRAAIAMLKSTGARVGVRIRLEKRLPSQAGLGGGSSDAAAVLKAVQRLLGGPLESAQLFSLAAQLGGDVPFFLAGGTCLVEGIGERVTALPDRAAQAVVIVKPEIGVSTAEAYAAIDRARQGRRSEQREDRDRISLSNDFEEVIAELCPEFLPIRTVLGSVGCSEAHLCGSGSAVYALLGDAGRSEHAALATEIKQRLAALPFSSGVMLTSTSTRTTTL